jgi:folate-binding protein YgfZ
MSASAELGALRESAVFVDFDAHGLLRATGNDRVSFLHRITSGKVAGVEPGGGSRTLLLDVRGHVLASLWVFVREQSLRVVVPGGQVENVADGLAKFAIMDDFQIAPEVGLTTLAVLGPKAGAALEAVGVPGGQALLAAPPFAHQEVASERFGAVWVAHGRRCGVDGLCVALSQPDRETLAGALVQAGTPRLPAEIAEAARIAALEPAPGKEITPERFPVEVGLGTAIDHGKGCYVGQETIVRMRDRGAVRKRLALLRLAGDELPSPGDPIASPGQPTAGQITSAARPSGESPLALAVLASAVAVGARVRVQHAGAEIPAEVIGDVPPWG